MANKGKDLTKEPRKLGELLKLEKKARQIGGDTEKSYLLFRYAGMHNRVIFPYDYSDSINIKDFSLREGQDEKNRDILIWNRPKKRGAKAFTTVPKHDNIDFNVDQFISEVLGRKSKYKRSTLYGNRIIKELGEAVNIYGLSPLSLRHTLAVELQKGGMKIKDICDTLNIAESTLRTYGRFLPEDRHSAYDRAMGKVD